MPLRMRSSARLHQVVDAGHLAVDRAGGDQAEQPGDAHGVAGSWRGLVGQADDGEQAGAGSVFHIASIAAIFIFWFWPAV